LRGGLRQAGKCLPDGDGFCFEFLQTGYSPEASETVEQLVE
jgi:hypothetical protein